MEAELTYPPGALEAGGLTSSTPLEGSEATFVDSEVRGGRGVFPVEYSYSPHALVYLSTCYLSLCVSTSDE
jgi:hypothetical protein